MNKKEEKLKVDLLTIQTNALKRMSRLCFSNEYACYMALELTLQTLTKMIGKTKARKLCAEIINRKETK